MKKSQTKKYRKLEPVMEINGKTVFCVNADEGNDDWLATARLQKAGNTKELERRLSTAVFVEEPPDSDL